RSPTSNFACFIAPAICPSRFQSRVPHVPAGTSRWLLIWPRHPVPPSSRPSTAASERARQRALASKPRLRCPITHPQSRPLILIVPADPGHREIEAVLIAALGHKVEVLIGGVEQVDASAVARIGVEHLAAFVLVKHADALLVRRGNRPNRIVVVRL